MLSTGDRVAKDTLVVRQLIIYMLARLFHHHRQAFVLRARGHVVAVLLVVIALADRQWRATCCADATLVPLERGHGVLRDDPRCHIAHHGAA